MIRYTDEQLLHASYAIHHRGNDFWMLSFKPDHSSTYYGIGPHAGLEDARDILNSVLLMPPAKRLKLLKQLIEDWYV